jgi:hypothetical protein
MNPSLDKTRALAGLSTNWLARTRQWPSVRASVSAARAASVA